MHFHLHLSIKYFIGYIFYKKARGKNKNHLPKGGTICKNPSAPFFRQRHCFGKPSLVKRHIVLLSIKNMTARYETMLIYAPELAETAVKKELDLLKKHISSFEGSSVFFEDLWGKRTLAYPIKKKDMGYYIVLRYSFPAQEMRNFDEELRIDTKLLRHLTIKLNGNEPELTYAEILKEQEEFVAEKLAGKRKVNKISTRKESLDIAK